MLKRIADTLGVFPDFAPALAPHHGVKLIICVEGPNDIAFISAISKIAHQADNRIVDLNVTQDIVIIPLGGSVLKDWVNHNYLQKLGTPEFHIYDSDNTNAHAIECDRINRRGDGSSARVTQKREMENYIHIGIHFPVFLCDQIRIIFFISRRDHTADKDASYKNPLRFQRMMKHNIHSV